MDSQINLENFLAFFHKNGHWGETLFEELRHREHKLISEEDFISGLEHIVKSSEREKIQLLFKFIFQGGREKNDGIGFHDFLSMLYNCPKEDLKQILNDREFIQQELKSHLIPVNCNQAKKGASYYSLESTNSTDIRHFIDEKEEKDTVRLSEKSSKSFKSNQKIDHSELPSLIGREVAKSLQTKHGNHQSIISLNYQGQEMNIKALNIQQLAKMFVQRIFRKANIDNKTGKLSFEQFEEWIINHTALYKNYYQGFHNEIWEVDLVTRQPKYLSLPFQKCSKGKALLQDQLINVKLFLFHSILIVCKGNDVQSPIAVICLDGLSVRRIFEEKIGFGIEISHRDGFYHDKKIFFEDESTLLEWLHLLECYIWNSLQNRYQIGEAIGRGKFSVVRRCSSFEDHQEYALKEIQVFKLSEEAKNLIALQSSIMQVVSHPLLLELKQCIQTKTHTYIITELIKGGDLFSYVKNKGRLNEKEAAKLCQQIIVGVRFLHSFDIVHRDLKPENIMVFMNQKSQQAQSIKIIDFGLSNYLAKIQGVKAEDNMVGTPNYIAPQLLREESFDFKIDNFSIGVILYYMLIGKLPFYSSNITQTLQKIMSNSFQFPEDVFLSNSVKDLIKNLLKNDPSERISLEQALEHEWFNILNKIDDKQ